MKGPPGPRGRGTGSNPANRFEGRSLEADPSHLEDLASRHPDGFQLATEVIEDHCRTVLNPIRSPDLPFRWTFNPYRGCEHGCIYCYARSDYERLGHSAGLDFETRIFAKLGAPEVLRRELRSPRWRGEIISLSGATDAWQPVERKLGITRRSLEVFVEARQAISVVTKSRLILRDIDLLQDLAKYDAVTVAVSLTSLDKTLTRDLEPRGSAPSERLQVIRELSQAGIPVQVFVAPVIPGLNDEEIPALLEAAAKAGARAASWMLLRLPGAVEALFREWLERRRPERAAKILRALADTRGGRLNDDRFGRRFRGEGVRARFTAHLFEIHARRLGLDASLPKPTTKAFRPPRGQDASGGIQEELFF